MLWPTWCIVSLFALISRVSVLVVGSFVGAWAILPLNICETHCYLSIYQVSRPLRLVWPVPPHQLRRRGHELPSDHCSQPTRDKMF